MRSRGPQVKPVRVYGRSCACRRRSAWPACRASHGERSSCVSQQLARSEASADGVQEQLLSVLDQLQCSLWSRADRLSALRKRLREQGEALVRGQLGCTSVGASRRELRQGRLQRKNLPPFGSERLAG